MTGRIDLAPPGRNPTEIAEFVRFAERNGYGGAWISEVNGLDAVTQAAVAGSALEGGRLGTAIVSIQARDPLLMAMTASALSQVSGGRFILGLGTSTRIIVEDWHARAWGRPLADTRAYVSQVRALMAGEKVTSDEGPYRLKRAALSAPVAAPVPIYLAALNDGMLELAGEIADGVILNFVSPAAVQHARERVAAGAERAGRNPAEIELVVYFRASVTGDFAEVRERYQRELLTYALGPVYQRMFASEGYGPMCTETEQRWKAGDRTGALGTLTDAFLQERVLAGTPAAIARRLDEYTAAGMDSAIIMPVPVPGRDHRSECENVIASTGRLAVVGVR